MNGTRSPVAASFCDFGGGFPITLCRTVVLEDQIKAKRGTECRRVSVGSVVKHRVVLVVL